MKIFKLFKKLFSGGGKTSQQFGRHNKVLPQMFQERLRRIENASPLTIVGLKHLAYRSPEKDNP